MLYKIPSLYTITVLSPGLFTEETKSRIESVKELSLKVLGSQLQSNNPKKVAPLLREKIVENSSINNLLDLLNKSYNVVKPYFENLNAIDPIILLYPPVTTLRKIERTILEWLQFFGENKSSITNPTKAIEILKEIKSSYNSFMEDLIKSKIEENSHVTIKIDETLKLNTLLKNLLKEISTVLDSEISKRALNLHEDKIKKQTQRLEKEKSNSFGYSIFNKDSHSRISEQQTYLPPIELEYLFLDKFQEMRYVERVIDIFIEMFKNEKTHSYFLFVPPYSLQKENSFSFINPEEKLAQFSTSPSFYQLEGVEGLHLEEKFKRIPLGFTLCKTLINLIPFDYTTDLNCLIQKTESNKDSIIQFVKKLKSYEKIALPETKEKFSFLPDGSILSHLFFYPFFIKKGELTPENHSLINLFHLPFSISYSLSQPSRPLGIENFCNFTFLSLLSEMLPQYIKNLTKSLRESELNQDFLKVFANQNTPKNYMINKLEGKFKNNEEIVDASGIIESPELAKICSDFLTPCISEKERQIEQVYKKLKKEPSKIELEKNKKQAMVKINNQIEQRFQEKLSQLAFKWDEEKVEEIKVAIMSTFFDHNEDKLFYLQADEMIQFKNEMHQILFALLEKLVLTDLLEIIPSEKELDLSNRSTPCELTDEKTKSIFSNISEEKSSSTKNISSLKKSDIKVKSKDTSLPDAFQSPSKKIDKRQDTLKSKKVLPFQTSSENEKSQPQKNLHAVKDLFIPSIAAQSKEEIYSNSTGKDYTKENEFERTERGIAQEKWNTKNQLDLQGDAAEKDFSLKSDFPIVNEESSSTLPKKSRSSIDSNQSSSQHSPRSNVIAKPGPNFQTHLSQPFANPKKSSSDSKGKDDIDLEKAPFYPPEKPTLIQSVDSSTYTSGGKVTPYIDISLINTKVHLDSKTTFSDQNKKNQKSPKKNIEFSFQPIEEANKNFSRSNESSLHSSNKKEAVEFNFSSIDWEPLSSSKITLLQPNQDDEKKKEQEQVPTSYPSIVSLETPLDTKNNKIESQPKNDNNGLDIIQEENKETKSSLLKKQSSNHKPKKAVTFFPPPSKILQCPENKEIKVKEKSTIPTGMQKSHRTVEKPVEKKVINPSQLLFHSDSYTDTSKEEPQEKNIFLTTQFSEGTISKIEQPSRIKNSLMPRKPMIDLDCRLWVHIKSFVFHPQIYFFVDSMPTIHSWNDLLPCIRIEHTYSGSKQLIFSEDFIQNCKRPERKIETIAGLTFLHYISGHPTAEEISSLLGLKKEMVSWENFSQYSLDTIKDTLFKMRKGVFYHILESTTCLTYQLIKHKCNERCGFICSKVSKNHELLTLILTSLQYQLNSHDESIRTTSFCLLNHPIGRFIDYSLAQLNTNLYRP
jgi:hypothetical protein